MSKGITSARTIVSQPGPLNDRSPKEALPLSGELAPGIPLIEFRNASFCYPSRPSAPVLRNLNMKIYSGQFVAMVGSSGCGKSTVIQLLEQFYDLESGELLIGGVPAKCFRNEEIRKLLSLVSQEPTLYSGSIDYNVALGLCEALSPEKLHQVLSQAQLSDFVSSLPEGINTEVGSRGTALSGGQKQRVAIARALARDSPILLLDEATSALDSESERMIQQAIVGDWEGASSNIAVKKTVIAVAHRLSTIQHADCIFVFDDGQIVEAGSHGELTERRGIYWRLCQAQAGLVDS
jgi:ATP-binding cassette subfamily B (MDR/TAP) protein 1